MKTLAANVESKIERIPELTCWVWVGAISSSGYGSFWYGGRCLLAHRHIYEQLRVPIPVGLTLDHLCRNRWCVNPDHLEPVTQTENIRRGPATKLTADQVREIHGRLKIAKRGERKIIARDFGISVVHIKEIKKGWSWKDIKSE